MNLSKYTILFADAETYFDPKDYTLRKMSVTEYVRDARFKCHGFGFVGLTGEPVWVSGKDMPAYLAKIDWKHTAVVCHNTKFDGAILSWVYGVNPALWLDTMSMGRAVLGARVAGFSLDKLAQHYTLETQKGFMPGEGIRDLPPEIEAQMATYNRGDLVITRDLFNIFVKDFPSSQYGPLDWTIRAFTEPHLVLNTALAAEISKTEAERRDAIILASGVEKAQLSSNDKFAKLLETNGFECPMKPSPKQKNEDGTPKAIPALALGDEDFLEMLESPNEKLRAFCEARVAAKSTLLTTRAAKFAKVGVTGAWPFDVQFSGAKQTHRLSGGKNGGGNPQNLSQCQDPEEHKNGHFCNGLLRKVVEAPAGHKLVVGDFSSIEPRIQAWISNDAHMIRQFTEKRDLYCDYGSSYYGRLITKADLTERKFSKQVILGRGYQMGDKRFKHTVFIELGQEIDDKDAKRAGNTYKMMYPGIVAMWDYLQNLLPRMAAGHKGFLPHLPAVKWDGPKFILPSGLEIRYDGLHQVEDKKRPGQIAWAYTGFRDKKQTPQTVNIYGGKMLENLCQALAGEICKEAIETAKYDAFTGLQVHDEIGQVVYDGWEQDAAARLEAVMSTSPVWWPQIKLAAEVGYGQNWLDSKH